MLSGLTIGKPVDCAHVDLPLLGNPTQSISCLSIVLFLDQLNQPQHDAFLEHELLSHLSKQIFGVVITAPVAVYIAGKLADIPEVSFDEIVQVVLGGFVPGEIQQFLVH